MSRCVLVLVVFVLSLVSCGPTASNQTPIGTTVAAAVAATMTAMPTATSRATSTAVPPTPTETPIACTSQAGFFVSQLKQLIIEWQDAEKVASKTPRLSLSSQIERLQGVQRKVQGLDAPACAVGVKQLYIQQMEIGVEAYLSFLANESNIRYGNLAGLAGWLADNAANALSTLEQGDTPPAGPVRLRKVTYAVSSSSDKWVEAELVEMTGRIPQMTFFVPHSHEFAAPAGMTLTLVATDKDNGGIAECEILVDDERLVFDRATTSGASATCTAIVPE